MIIIYHQRISSYKTDNLHFYVISLLSNDIKRYNQFKNDILHIITDGTKYIVNINKKLYTNMSNKKLRGMSLMYILCCIIYVYINVE